MARIPFDMADIPSVDARSLGGMQEAPVSGNRPLAEGLSGVGQAFGQIGQAVDSQIEDEKHQNVAALTASSSFTPTMMQMRSDAPPGAAGFTDSVSQAYDQHVADATDSIQDPEVRNAVKLNLLNRKASYLDEAATFQYQANIDNQKNVASAALNSVSNNFQSVAQQNPANAPAEFARSAADYGALVDTLPGVPGDQKTAMKLSAMHSMASGYVMGSLLNANTSDGVQNVYNLMSSPAIKNALSPQDYSNLMRKVWVRGRSLSQQESAGLSASVASLNQRINAGMQVSPEDIQAVENTPGLMRNPSAQFALADVKAKVDVNNTYGRAPIATLQQALADYRSSASSPGNPSMLQGLPAQLCDDAQAASSITGQSPAYLASTARMEYGGLLNSGDFGQGPTQGGSARGVMQFQPATWAELVRNNPDAIGQAMQPPRSAQEVQALPPEQVQALRSDPRVSMTGAGLYANQNKAALSQTLGREPNDAELYVSHLLGTQGGAQFLNAVQNTPDSAASAVVGSGAAQANKSLFFDAQGQPLSCAQAFSNIGARFSASPARVAFTKAQQVQRLLNTAVQRYNADPAGYAMQTGAQGMAPLSDDAASWQQRGQALQAFAAQQGTTGPNGKKLAPVMPFTNSEAQGFASLLADPLGSAASKVNLLAQVQNLGDPTMIRRGYQQIGVKDPMAGMMGSLVSSTGDTSVATAVMEGRSQITKNPGLLSQLNIKDSTTASGFYSYVGGAMAGMPPDPMGRNVGATTMAAALAHYVHSKYNAGMSGTQTWSDSDFAPSIDAVLGGTPGHKAIQNVNNAPTMMPQGIDGSDIENFLANASSADLARVSINGKPPMYAPSPGVPERPIPPSQLRYAKLQYAGSGNYSLVLGNNGTSTASTGADENGRRQVYYMKLNVDTLRNNASGLQTPRAVPQGQSFAPVENVEPEVREEGAPSVPQASAPGASPMVQEMMDNQLIQMDEQP